MVTIWMAAADRHGNGEPPLGALVMALADCSYAPDGCQVLPMAAG